MTRWFIFPAQVRTQTKNAVIPAAAGIQTKKHKTYRLSRERGNPDKKTASTCFCHQAYFCGNNTILDSRFHGNDAVGYLSRAGGNPDKKHLQHALVVTLTFAGITPSWIPVFTGMTGRVVFPAQAGTQTKNAVFPAAAGTQIQKTPSFPRTRESR
jgi:hypothetical protein